MLDLGPVGAGNRVLDVGCGIGLEAVRLAARVGERGLVVGIDRSAAMVAEARRRALESGLPVEYAVMDARRLGFPDGAFDLCRTERVLRYVERPERAVGEMARVVRPGGRVVAFDFDSDATVIDAPDPALTRRVREILDAAVPNCWIGRQLPRLFRRVGLKAKVRYGPTPRPWPHRRAADEAATTPVRVPLPPKIYLLADAATYAWGA